MPWPSASSLRNMSPRSRFAVGVGQLHLHHQRLSRPTRGRPAAPRGGAGGRRRQRDGDREGGQAPAGDIASCDRGIAVASRKTVSTRAAPHQGVAPIAGRRIARVASGRVRCAPIPMSTPTPPHSSSESVDEGARQKIESIAHPRAGGAGGARRSALGGPAPPGARESPGRSRTSPGPSRSCSGALSLLPGDPEMLRDLADLREQAGRPGRRRRGPRGGGRPHRRIPAEAAARYATAARWWEERIGRRDRAALLYGRAFRLAPDLFEARRRAVACAEALGRHVHARRLLDAWRDAGGDRGELAGAYAHLGALLVDEPLEHGLALEATVEAMLLDRAAPGAADVLERLRSAPRTWRDQAQALETRAAVERDRREAARIWLRLAALHVAYDPDGAAMAREAFDRAWLAAPGHPRALDLLERWHGEREDWTGPARGAHPAGAQLPRPRRRGGRQPPAGAAPARPVRRRRGGHRRAHPRPRPRPGERRGRAPPLRGPRRRRAGDGGPLGPGAPPRRASPPPRARAAPAPGRVDGGRRRAAGEGPAHAGGGAARGARVRPRPHGRSLPLLETAGAWPQLIETLQAVAAQERDPGRAGLPPPARRRGGPGPASATPAEANRILSWALVSEPARMATRRQLEAVAARTRRFRRALPGLPGRGRGGGVRPRDPQGAPATRGRDRGARPRARRGGGAGLAHARRPRPRRPRGGGCLRGGALPRGAPGRAHRGALRAPGDGGRTRAARARR